MKSTQTYGLPVVYEQNAGRTEDVWRLAPEAGYLLTAAFPYLTLAQADDILTKTEGPGGASLIMVQLLASILASTFIVR